MSGMTALGWLFGFCSRFLFTQRWLDCRSTRISSFVTHSGIDLDVENTQRCPRGSARLDVLAYYYFSVRVPIRSFPSTGYAFSASSVWVLLLVAPSLFAFLYLLTAGLFVLSSVIDSQVSIQGRAVFVFAAKTCRVRASVPTAATLPPIIANIFKVSLV